MNKNKENENFTEEPLFEFKYSPYVYILWYGFSLCYVAIMASQPHHYQDHLGVIGFCIISIPLFMFIWNIALCGRDYVTITVDDITIVTYSIFSKKINVFRIADINSYSLKSAGYRSHAVWINSSTKKVPIQANHVGWGFKGKINEITKHLEHIGIRKDMKPHGAHR